MINKDTSKEQLLTEIDQLKAKISEFEKSEIIRLSNEWASKNGEKDLKQSEEKFRKAFSINPDSLNINRLEDGIYVSINEGFTKIMGYSESEVIGKTSLELNIWENPEDRNKLVHGLKTKGKVDNFEAKFRAKSGELKDGLMSAIIIELDGIPHILNFTQDITERLAIEKLRKQTEKELKESEEKLRAVFENSTNLFYSHSTDHIISYLSPQVKDILGYSPEEAMIKWTELASDNPINESGFENTVRAIETGERQAPYELELIRKNGEKVWVEVREAPLVKDGKTISIVGSLTDITERKKAEKKLRQSEARFKRLFNELGDAVFVTKIGGANMGDILEVNSAASKQTGYTKQELLQMNIIKDLCIPDTGLISTKDWDKKLIAGKTVVTTEKKRKKDGTEIWTEVIVTPIEFKGEIASLSINHDITSRKIAEDALKESEEHFRAMFENASIGFYRTAPEGEILYANPALIAILGYKDFDELSQRNLEKDNFDIVNPRSEILDQIDRLGYLKGYESTWKAKDNRTISVRENSKAYYNQDGKVIYYEGTIEDISEEKQAELLLKESEEKYRTLIDNIQDGVFLINEGKIIFANEAFASIIGYTIEEVIGEDFKKFVAPEDMELVVNNYEKRMKGDSAPNEYEFRAIHKDGITRIYVNMTVDRINYENKPAALGTIKDISETKKMQEQLSGSTHLNL